MEVLATVAAFVPVVLSLADKALKHLNRGGNSEAKESIGILRQMLSTFQEYLSYNKEEGQQAQARKLTEAFLNNIRDLTFEIEDALDGFMFNVPLHFHSSKFRKNVHDLAHFFENQHAVRMLSNSRERIQKKTKRLEDSYKLLDMAATPVNMTGNSSTDESYEGGEMVGFKNRRNDLLKQLICGDSALATILVVGPGGSGKTFLVNNIYRDAMIETTFTYKAWIDMSPHVIKRTELGHLVLEKFFSRHRVEQILNDQAGSTGEKLHRSLKDSRYLIVLDNITSKQDCLSIANFLPSGSTGSRIIITTRYSNVVNERPNYTHKLDGLSIVDEALDLLYRKAFPGRQGNANSDTRCPEALRELSKRIVARCDRLPLVISAVGSLLSKKQEIYTDWKRLCDNIGSEIKSDDSSLFNRVLKPSFVDLPDDLKSCFLYFSMFPEGQSIERGRLVRSWIGEGFLRVVNGKTSEEVAETCLNDLIARSLVRVSTSKIDDRVKSCNVLRLHHEFIVQLYGNKENFVTVINEKNPSPSAENVRRLSVHHDNIVAKLLELNDLSHVRTLFAFGDEDVWPKERSKLSTTVRKRIPGTTENQIEKMFRKFKLLKVLDLQGMPLGYFPKDINTFVLLRCLNLRQTNIETVPRSIKKLIFLEVLDLKYTLVTELPSYIYNLEKLSHLLVSFRGLDSSGEARGVKVDDGIGALSKSLQKVSLINVRNHEGFIEELGNLKQLRKLGLADLKRDSGPQVFRSIQKMENLATLDVRARAEEYLELEAVMEKPLEHIQHLYLKGQLRCLPAWISGEKLPSLVKVVLKGSKLNADQSILKKLGDLKNLMELEMVECYTGESLVFREQMFKKLKKLHVEKFEELIETSLEGNALAMLEKLTICHCKKLRPLPRKYSVAGLKELLVFEMSSDFISDIQRRIHEAELVDHIQTFETSSSTSGPGNIRQIQSQRLYS